MQIVIDMTEEDYNNIKPFLNGETIKGGFNLFKALEIIKNGTPLPKGHGRLVDADEMVKILRKSEYYQEKRGDFYGADVTSRVKNFIEDTETVIAADKEASNE